MSAFRVDQRVVQFLAVVVAACLLAASAAPATAQLQAPGKPLLLAPPKALEPLPAETGAKPRRGRPSDRREGTAGGAGGSTSPPAEGRPESGIQVDALTTPDSESVGTLGGADGGFGVAMWQGTRRALVDALLPRLPVNATSPAMRDLMRRLLLSAAAAPRGESEKGRLVALRARLLAEMGEYAGVSDLLEATPERAENERLVRIEADARFLANDNARACALAAGQIVRSPSAYWQKAFVFCQALAAHHDKAALGTALLREMGEEDDVFFMLIEALATGAAPTIESLPRPTPLHLTMARAAKARLPADVISSNRPGSSAPSPSAPTRRWICAWRRPRGPRPPAPCRSRRCASSIPACRSATRISPTPCPRLRPRAVR